MIGRLVYYSILAVVCLFAYSRFYAPAEPSDLWKRATPAGLRGTPDGKVLGPGMIEQAYAQVQMENQMAAIAGAVLIFAVGVGLFEVTVASKQRRRSPEDYATRPDSPRTRRRAEPAPSSPPGEIKCWSCRAALPVTEDNRGKSIKCPACGTKQRMPS